MKKISTMFLLTGVSLGAEIDWPQLRVVPQGAGALLPVQVVQPPDGTGRFFVVEQLGRIQVYQPGSSTPELFLDISDHVSFFFGSEDGLLSMAFPPGFSTKQYFYVFYTDAFDYRHVLARFNVSSTNSNVADKGSEQVLLGMPRVATTVNSGQLLFGRDNYLYVGVGDGGFEPQLGSSAQNPMSFLGKILRLDVESNTNAYQIPPSNPFVGNAKYLPEIWALGVRNPYRFTFDRLTGDLYIGDVGQLAWEEVNYQPAGAAGVNYGWPIREAKHTYQIDTTVKPSSLADPFFEMQHLSGPSAVIDGFVYRGPPSVRMDGVYFFSDFYFGRIRGAKRVGNQWQVETISEPGRFISSFGEDSAGRLYITDYLAGEFLLLEEDDAVAPPRFTPPEGIISSDTITLSCISTGVMLRYTFEDRDIEQTDPTILPGATLTVTNGATLKAYAFRTGLGKSDVTTATYTLKAAAPTFAPPQGPLANGAPITLSSATPGATIRYTLDGSDPTSGSTLYTAPIPYNSAATLKARGFKAGFLDSSVATFSQQPLKFGSIDIVGFYGDTALRWSSQTGLLYQLQFTDDFSAWYDVVPPLEGTGAQLSYTNNQVFPLRDGRSFRLQSVQP